MIGAATRRSPVRVYMLQCACFVVVVAAVFAFVRPRPLFAAADHYSVSEIKPDVFVWVAEDIIEQEGDPRFERPANAGFVITKDGVVVVNTTNTPFNGRALLYEIRKRTELPVKYVIDTSASPDETLGNEVFEDLRPPILSTPAAESAMRRYQENFSGRMDDDWKYQYRMRGIHPTPANRTFSNEFTVSDPGAGASSSQPVKVMNLGRNASPGDACVFLPKSKVLFLGSLFDNEFIPQAENGDIHHWIDTLRKVENWDVDLYVPAHGEPGGRQQVEQFRRFLEWLSGEVETGIHEGKTLKQVQDQLVPFKSYNWHAPELEPKIVAEVYAELNTGKSSGSH